MPGGDVILVLGPEPALRWRLFCEQIVGVADAPRGTDGAHARRAPRRRAAQPTRCTSSAPPPTTLDRPLRAAAQPVRGPDGNRRCAARRVHARRHPCRVAVGGGARLRRAGAVAEGVAGARRAGVRDDGYSRAGLGARRPVAPSTRRGSRRSSMTTTTSRLRLAPRVDDSTNPTIDPADIDGDDEVDGAVDEHFGIDAAPTRAARSTVRSERVDAPRSSSSSATSDEG